MTRQLGCSFARVAVWDLIIADLPNDQAFESFQQKFIGNRKMQIERTLFDRVLSTLKNSYKKWKKDKRQPYLDYFDKTRWLGIAEQERARHSIGVCVPCLSNMQNITCYSQQPTRRTKIFCLWHRKWKLHLHLSWCALKG